MTGLFEPFELTEYEDKPHRWLEPGIVAAGCTTLIHGEPGCGKTWLALSIAKRVIDTGDTVVFVDLESGPSRARQRVIALGLDMDGLLYLRDAPVTLANAAEFVNFVDDYPPALVIFDSLANSLAVAGLQENDNTAVTQWWQAYLHPITRLFGTGVIVIDHDVKNGSSGYSRGAGAKKAQADFDFSLSVQQPFDRERIGLVTLKSQKPGGRSGDAVDAASFRMGGSDGAFVCDRIEGGGPPSKTLSGLQCEIIEALAGNTGISKSTLMAATSVESRDAIRKPLDDLIRRRLVRVEGEGRNTRYFAFEP